MAFDRPTQPFHTHTITNTHAQLSVITGSLAFALPVAMSLFPQQAAFKAQDLEPQYHNLKDSRGRPITTLYCNKGL